MRQSIWILGWSPQGAIKIHYTIRKVNKILSRIAHRKLSSSRSMSGEGQVMSRKVRLALSSEHYSGKVTYLLFTIQIDPWTHIIMESLMALSISSDQHLYLRRPVLSPHTSLGQSDVSIVVILTVSTNQRPLLYVALWLCCLWTVNLFWWYIGLLVYTLGMGDWGAVAAGDQRALTFLKTPNQQWAHEAKWRKWRSGPWLLRWSQDSLILAKFK